MTVPAIFRPPSPGRLALRLVALVALWVALVLAIALVLTTAGGSTQPPTVAPLFAGPGPVLVRQDAVEGPGPEAGSATVKRTFRYRDGTEVVIVQVEEPEEAPFALGEALERARKVARRRPGLRTVIDLTGKRAGRK